MCTVIAQRKVNSQSICCVHALTWQSCQLLAVQHQESQPAHLLTHLHTYMTLFVMFDISRNNTQTYILKFSQCAVHVKTDSLQPKTNMVAFTNVANRVSNSTALVV